MQFKSAIVYLIHQSGTQFIKIGYCRGKVQTRIDSLQTGNPFELKLLSCFESNNPQLEESHYHHLFRIFHFRGEWFAVPPSYIEDVSWFLPNLKSA